jgi:hypothetical protein
VLQKYFAHRSHTNDTVTMQGTAQFKASGRAKWLAPFMRIAGMPLMHTAENVPASVQIASVPTKHAVAFHHQFEFPNGKKPLIFLAELEPQGLHNLIFWTKDDTGWRTEMTYDSKRINMNFGGYCGRLFGKIFRLPVAGLIGECTAWLEPIDSNSLSLCVEMRRRNGSLFYAYNAQFTISGVMRRD